MIEIMIWMALEWEAEEEEKEEDEEEPLAYQ